MPDRFALDRGQQDSIARLMPEHGSLWVGEYQKLFPELLDQWSLESRERLLGGLPINVVVGCYSPQYGDVVLKFGVPHKEQLTEAAALKVFAQHHNRVPVIYEYSEPQRAMLMQWIRPGKTLLSQSLSDDDKTRQAIPLIRELPVPVPFAHEFPDYAAWLEKAGDIFLGSSHADKYPQFSRLVMDVLELYQNLSGGSALLHGDLHHLNMINDQAGLWYSIDPKGVIGKRPVEMGRFLHNFITLEDRAKIADLLASRCRILAEGLGYTLKEVFCCGLIDKVLSVCWDFESGGDNQQAVTVAEVLSDLFTAEAAI